MSEQKLSSAPRLVRSLSPLSVWALSFGCSVGWGAFVMPGTTFLPIGGPMGTVLGLAVGALIMFLIGYNYHYLTNRFPDAGGTFCFVKELFGYDHGFLSAWFLVLVYLAIIWANATAIPLIARALFGDLFQFGFHYTLAGFDVWFGEILLSLSALILFGLLCLQGARAAAGVQILTALLLLGGAACGFIAAFARPDAIHLSQAIPPYTPDRPAGLSVLFIVFLAPWAYAGFESVSHSSEEFKFPVKKTMTVLAVSLVTSALTYIMLALIAVSALPEGFSGWREYVGKLGSLQGVAGFPVFHGAHAAAGALGLAVLGVAAAAGIITGLVGNTTAASRMIYAMARDDLLPAPLAKLNDRGVPEKAVLLLILVSLPIPFFGRAAISWIVDVNTIGITVAYAYTSAAAFRSARREKRLLPTVTGAAGMGVAVFFLLYFLLPTAWSRYTMSQLATESYLMLVAWAMLGFVIFYLLFRWDPARRLGKSTAVWVALLLLMFFTSFVWVRGTTRSATEAAVAEMDESYSQAFHEAHSDRTALQMEAYDADLSRHIDRVTGTTTGSMVVQFVLTLLSLLIIFKVYASVQKQHQTAVQERTRAEHDSRAKTTFLSNMSHDIRTPMNAIVGYVTLAKRTPELTPKLADYLDKIEASSGHLLSLINDVLEMSRIESGKMELAPVPTDVRKMMDSVRSMFATQMETKGLTYTVDCTGVTDTQILCDQNRLDRVLLNLVSNAYKFTPAGGSVTVTMRQTGREGDVADYLLSVKDTGIGMSPEFAARVFEAYERERTAAVENIQGTGLGTAITKSIVELMGGTIEVFSEQGKGSEFVIRLSFPVDPDAAAAAALAPGAASARAFAGLRLLLVEDDKASREVEQTLLTDAGFLVDAVVNGEDAAEAIAASVPGAYAAVLMDIQMPVKDGYAAARLIRALKNRDLASIPIIAITAKAFSEDVAASRAAGMDAHLAKPLNIDDLTQALAEVLTKAGTKPAENREEDCT